MHTSTNFQIYNASAGSGKTFTLVKEYLKILLSTGANFDIYRFQKILAITFTNKAAAEMKVRVLENLKDFSEGNKVDMLYKIEKEISLDQEVIQQRSKRILNAILQNYSGFNITTIDAFTHRLIRNFSFDLGLSLNFEVEMDANQLLSEAVDLLISKIGMDKNLTQVLIEYSLEKSEEDKSWDISMDLKEFAKILLKENDIEQLKKLDEKTIEEFKELKKSLIKKNAEIEISFKEIGKQGLEIMESMGLEHKDFYRSMLPNHFKNLAYSFEKVTFFDQNKLRERIEENTFYSNSKSDDIKTAIEEILPPLLELYWKSEKLYEKYTLNNLMLKSLIPLATLKHINDSLNEIKEQNNIRLNAEFNKIIAEEIKNEPAPFIYERIGEKFQYFFIDEMQDTSELQWQNLIPLVENALVSESIVGESGKLLLVGDAKQSIYRWRGGKAEQFIELTNDINTFSIPVTKYNLETNYRSCANIVDFNNEFFNHVSNFFNTNDYKDLYIDGNKQLKNTKEGGYVQISLVEKNKDDPEKELVIPNKVLEVINNLDSNFNLSDVCVLVRKKKDGVAIANHLTKYSIPIISSETLLLKNNVEIEFVINLLKYINRNDDKQSLTDSIYFILESKNKEIDKHQYIDSIIHLEINTVFERLNELRISFNLQSFFSFSFYNSIEYLLRAFDLHKNADAYIISFLDVVLEFQNKKGVSLQEFLEYWDLKEDGLSISLPEGQNAVQIMTIHKSKGLEFPIVIFPYDLDIYRELKPKIWYDKLGENKFLGFETSLIDYSKRLNYIGSFGQELYQKRRAEIQLDSLNLLYVALTRAEEQLYIITEKRPKQNPVNNATFYSDFFVDFLKSKTNTDRWKINEHEGCLGSKNRHTNISKLANSIDMITQENFISTTWNNHNISIVTNSSKLWDTKQEKSIVYGNLIHEMLSKIISHEDIDEVIQRYLFDGIINVEEEVEISKKIKEVIFHPSLQRYFDKNSRVLNERELLSNSKEIQIPDRIVFLENKVSILDYKTGKPKKEYHFQLNKYENVMKELGYEVEAKILVYIDSKLVIEKVK